MSFKHLFPYSLVTLFPDSDPYSDWKVPAATVSLVQPKHNNLKKKVSSVNDRGPIPKEVKTPSVKVETPSVEVLSVEAPSVETPLVDRTSEVVKPVAEELSAKPKPKKSWFSCCGTKVTGVGLGDQGDCSGGSIVC